jgi:hypothetical protein
VGGCNGELPLITAPKLLSQQFDVLGINEHTLNNFEKLTSRLSQPKQPLALSDKELNTEFILQVLDVFAHAGLGRVKRVAHLGEVVVAFNRFSDDAKLLKIHKSILNGAGRAARDCGALCTGAFEKIGPPRPMTVQ